MIGILRPICGGKAGNWSERRDSNPRPLPPQSSGYAIYKHLQGITRTERPVSFRIGSHQSAANLGPGSSSASSTAIKKAEATPTP
jgi:hypothetical protein